MVNPRIVVVFVVNISRSHRYIFYYRVVLKNSFLLLHGLLHFLPAPCCSLYRKCVQWTASIEPPTDCQLQPCARQKGECKIIKILIFQNWRQNPPSICPDSRQMRSLIRRRISTAGGYWVLTSVFYFHSNIIV